MKLGSLCSGIGGLDLAVEAHFGAELAWVSEIDPAASRVLAARFPGVPNLGDFRDVTPLAVDILCGGFPCQPVSSAGKRAGTDDERWLFDDICTLLGRMDAPPRVLVFENVAGLLTANDGHAMARVVHGLAALGYVGSWRSVRAADAGACHRRERVFIVATHTAFASGEARDGRRADEHVRAAVYARPDSPADATRVGCDGERVVRHDRQTPGNEAVQGAAGRGDRDAADADRAAGPVERWRRPGQAVHEPGTVERSGRRDRVAWGDFGPAVARWEHVMGRAAPAPVDDRGRLNPVFVEWMMGYPAGWCTDVLDRRTDALRCLGNAVVPHQARLALNMLEAS